MVRDRIGALGSAVRLLTWIGLGVCLVFGMLVGISPGAGASTKPPIQIGFELTGNAGAKQSSVAGVNVSPYSSGQPFIEAMAKWINSHGGLGGHQIQPVLYSHDFTSPTDFQDLCTTFFQDNHIFVDVPFATSPSEYPCFQQNHAILLGPGGTTAEFNKYAGNLYAVASMPIDVYLKNYAIDVVKSHWIKPGSKVGLIYANNSDIATAVQQEVIPYLKSHGVKLADTGEAIQILDVASFQEAQVPTQNAVLRFKQEGITQILMPAWGEYNLLIWLRDAVPQNYFPAYAFGDGVVGGANEKNDSLLVPTFPIKLFDGSMLVATGVSDQVNPPVAPLTLKCQSIYASEGISIPTRPSSSDSTSPYGYSICEHVLFLQQVFAKGNVTNLASFKQAADSLGSSVIQPGPPGIVLNASHPYMGETELRDFKYVDSCTCYQVSDNWHHVVG